MWYALIEGKIHFAGLAGTWDKLKVFILRCHIQQFLLYSPSIDSVIIQED